MLLLVVMVPNIIIPALVLIHVIWKNEQLHIKYYLSVANLLTTDILTTMRFTFEMFSMMLYLFGVDVIRFKHLDILYSIITIPRVATLYAFILLTINRVIGVGLPYHHRKIMTTKVAYGIAIIVKATTTFPFVRPFGFCQAPSSPVAVIAVALPMFGSVILTVITNAYLYYVTVQSNRKLQQNLKLSERDEQKINRLRRLVHTFQTQAKPTLSVLILGGTDCAVNVL